MKAVLQRVSRANVCVKDTTISAIESGWVVLLGVTQKDSDADVDYLCDKIVNLRAFEDENDKLNLSVQDINGEILVVSQFTLYGDCRKGRRPSFSAAAKPEIANKLYESFCQKLASYPITVKTGQFQAHMAVELVNDGPVTFLLDSDRSCP